jgi:hypothetical protein
VQTAPSSSSLKLKIVKTLYNKFLKLFFHSQLVHKGKRPANTSRSFSRES